MLFLLWPFVMDLLGNLLYRKAEFIDSLWSLIDSSSDLIDISKKLIDTPQNPARFR